ncbi:MAG: N-formylglutamate amidohydrolase [Bdellovibrio sp.]|jgi:N-formylglutamate deformylase
MFPFFVTIPHSGEKVPEFCTWLVNLPEPILMCDVDRYVDRLYEPYLKTNQISFVKTEWHRYAADMNRVPSDVDASSVVGSANPAGTFSRGFHWVMTTTRQALMGEPMTLEMHRKLVQLIYEPFHQSIRNHYEKFSKQGAREVFHLDVHSMPSRGTEEHRDPGERRAEIVVSDSRGKSSRPDYVDLIINSYVRAGFKVGYNWPYYGGRVTEQYGAPAKGQHCVQVEISRALYMDEVTKAFKPIEAEAVQKKIQIALDLIRQGLPKLIS